MEQIMKDQIICNNHVFTRAEFVALCVECGSQAKIAERLGCKSRTPVRTAIKKYFPNLRPGATLKIALLESEGLAECSVCSEIKTIEENFYKSVSKPRGIESACVSCDKERYARDKDWKNVQKKGYYENNKELFIEKSRHRQLAKKNRTPAWADRAAIKEIYKNCPEGHHVDHVIPLQGKTVSGLHVETNLQYLTAEENLKKGNKFK